MEVQSSRALLNESFASQYKLKELIGQGSYGIVQLATVHDKEYAIKIISRRKLLQQNALIQRSPRSRRKENSVPVDNPLTRVYKEIAILKKLNHPNVIKLVEALDDVSEENFYLVFEYMKKGEILSIPTCHPLSEQQAWKYFRDIILGIEYLHYQKIIHRDIKPSNLLLSEDDCVKIIDFGICNEFIEEDIQLTNTLGTPAFIPAEAIISTIENGKISSYSGRQADIWQIGITLYSLVYGYVPFHDNNIVALYSKIRHNEVVFHDIPSISPQLKDLILQMLDKDPAQRITVSQIKQHEWVTRQMSMPLPNEQENCSAVHITDEDIFNSVRPSNTSMFNTLTTVKAMIRNHSFVHPFKEIGKKL